MTGLQRMTPMLAVSNLQQTIAFYCDQLGFQCTGTFGEPEPVWCHLKRDGVELMFNSPPADEIAAVPARADSNWLWFGQPPAEAPAVRE
jgi:catechol 2,3-dioxygenase-like lactoylglutathione lyase family enzyme